MIKHFEGSCVVCGAMITYDWDTQLGVIDIGVDGIGRTYTWIRHYATAPPEANPVCARYSSVVWEVDMRSMQEKEDDNLFRKAYGEEVWQAVKAEYTRLDRRLSSDEAANIVEAVQRRQKSPLHHIRHEIAKALSDEESNDYGDGDLGRNITVGALRMEGLAYGYLEPLLDAVDAAIRLRDEMSSTDRYTWGDSIEIRRRYDVLSNSFKELGVE